MVDKRSTETHKQTFDQKHQRLAGHHRSYRSLWTHLRQGERGNQRARCLPCDKGCPVRSPAIEGAERNQPLLWHKLSWSLWSYHAAHSTGLPPSPLAVKTRLWERRSQECLLLCFIWKMTLSKPEKKWRRRFPCKVPNTNSKGRGNWMGLWILQKVTSQFNWVNLKGSSALRIVTP